MAVTFGTLTHSEGIPTMEDTERFRLLGRYRTPRFRIGQRVFCEVRGERAHVQYAVKQL
jgi:hypothetical protein